MAKDLIVIKGSRDGLKFYFNTQEGSFEEIYQTLVHKFQEAKGFFEQAKYIIDEKNDLKEEERKKIEALFILHGMTRQETDHKKTANSHAAAGIDTNEETEVFQAARDAVLIARSLRSGQKIYVQGDAVIRGDVNPGAQVSATGNIIIFGACRGSAHAGVQGDINAFVMACKLRPTQIAIADKISRAPEASSPKDEQVYPEIAFISDQQIVVEPYISSKHKAANA